MFENVTYESILERMLARVPGQFDKREGSVIWDTHSPTAIEFQILYLELDAVIRETYGDTASREFLILRCRERGIAPFEATNAVLKGEFTPTSIDMVGKRFNIGALNYVVTKKITDGEYQVQCETAGIIGNQYLGAMIPMEYIEGLETSELTEVLIPGEDEEATEDLRQRYFDSFQENAFGGNVRDYLNKVNAIQGVGAAKVTRVWNSGIRPADMIPSAEVQAWYAGIIETLNKEVTTWLSTVYVAALEKKLTTGGTVLLTILNSDYGIASDTLVQAVQQIFDPVENAGEGYGIAPIGHVVAVAGAKGVPITVKSTITFEAGYSWSNLQSSIDAIISDYLLALRKEWAETEYLVVRISQIETRLLALKGVLDIGNTRINGRAINLTLEKNEVPVFGGVSA